MALVEVGKKVTTATVLEAPPTTGSYLYVQGHV